MATERVVFDFPTGWKVLEATNPEHHHERCSYRTESRALFCDCAAIAAADAAWQLAHARMREAAELGGGRDAD